MMRAHLEGEPKPSVSTAPATCPLKPEYTFERFVRGEGNRLACAASVAVAENPGKAYNPLFLYGGVGLGKTHLLHAVGNFISRQSPWLRVQYVTSERFAIELVRSIQENKTPLFRKAYRAVDLLLIDDVQFLRDKTSTQEELFHTFNELYDRGKQIVLSSDRPPEELKELQERLVSRFRWGLVADIQAPSFETRLAILKSKAVENNLELPDGILEMIARRVASNVRALEGALIRAVAYSSLQNRPLDDHLISEMLPQEVPQPRMDIAWVKEEILQQYEVTLEQLEGESRERKVAQARQIAIYLARELTNSSFPAIGKAFGNRDHTTIMHAYQKVKELTQSPLFRNEIEEMKERLLTKLRATA
jgi:chromosomal replication initiator protein